MYMYHCIISNSSLSIIRRIELLIGYDNIVANTTDLSHTCIIADDNDSLESQSAPKDTTITLVATKDSNIINQLSQVLDI